MTEMNQMPQGPASPDDDLEPSKGSGVNRRLLLVIGGAALVVAALGGFFLLRSGGSTPEAVVVVHPAVTPSGQPSAAATKQGGQTVPAVYHGQAGTNPFKPLPGEAAKPSPSPTGSAGAPTPAPSNGGGSTPTAASSYQVTVKSVHVSSQTADLWVNGVKYNGVGVGDTFASTFRLDSVGVDNQSGKSYVTLTFGDVAAAGKKYENQSYWFSP